MAHAICIKCGDTKGKALDACPECGFVPETSHDKAQSMVATTHSMREAKLAEVSAALMRGEPLELPFELVLEYMDMFEGRTRAEAPVPIPGKGCGYLLLFFVLTSLVLVFVLSL
ncbi:MAG TPA: hypothetical protein VLA56_12130 [Pseudomonadales bacterium]|nr:hypothetical protein [Pseudomonadales bacterium]